MLRTVEIYPLGVKLMIGTVLKFLLLDPKRAWWTRLYVAVVMTVVLFSVHSEALSGETSPQQQGKLLIAVVDMDRIFNEYQELRKADEEYRFEVKRRQEKLEVREMLKPEEISELDNLETLEAEGKLTNEGRKKLEELRRLSEERRNLMKILMTKKLTDEEKKQYAELQEITRSNEPLLKKLQEKYDEELDRLMGAYLDRLGKRIYESVQAVAQRYGIKLVLAKKGIQRWQSVFDEFVLYADATVEITQEVLNILNAPPEAKGKEQPKK
jgi:Skp family chaperone for outer membrane proteins